MGIPSNKSSIISQVKSGGWRIFLLEYLCGVLTVAWYLFALAERSTFRVLTSLTKYADSFSDDPSRGGGEFCVLFDDPESSFALERDAYPRRGSQYHISWILILACLTGLSAHPFPSQTTHRSNADSSALILPEAKSTVTEMSGDAPEAEWPFLASTKNVGLSSGFFTRREHFGFERGEH